MSRVNRGFVSFSGTSIRRRSPFITRLALVLSFFAVVLILFIALTVFSSNRLMNVKGNIVTNVPSNILPSYSTTSFQSADGQRYRMFSSGEKVLNASASNFLYKFANKGREILDKLFNGTSHSYNNVVPGVVANNIQLGDIVIQGNADKSTVSEIRRAQRENLEQMLKQLNRLK